MKVQYYAQFRDNDASAVYGLIVHASLLTTQRALDWWLIVWQQRRTSDFLSLEQGYCTLGIRRLVDPQAKEFQLPRSEWDTSRCGVNIPGTFCRTLVIDSCIPIRHGIPLAVLARSRVESAIVEPEEAPMDKSKDQDRRKGAMEQDQPNQGGNTSMQGQLGHRDEDEELKDADADLSG
jgi:hypothetical protein